MIPSPHPQIWPLIQPFAFIPNWMTGDVINATIQIARIYIFLSFFISLCFVLFEILFKKKKKFFSMSERVSNIV